MEKLVLYHGSERIIKTPIYGFGNEHNDYGLCFYCCADIGQSKEWACRNRDSGYLNVYDFDKTNLKILDLTDKNKYSVLNWIAVLLHNRNVSKDFYYAHKPAFEYLEQFYIDIDEFDVIIGYRADDSYFEFPKAFVDNRISFERLEEIYLLGDLGVQIAIKSKKAFKRLKFTNYLNVEIDYRYKYQSRIAFAKMKYNEIVVRCINERGTFIREMISDYDSIHK